MLKPGRKTKRITVKILQSSVRKGWAISVASGPNNIVYPSLRARKEQMEHK